MKGQLEMIEEGARGLAEKKSWIREGFQELIQMMNDISIKELVSDFHIDVLFETVESCEYPRGYPTRCREKDIFFRFETKQSPHFCLIIQEYKQIQKEIDIDAIPTEVLQKIVSELPTVLEKMIEELEAKNKKYEKVKNLLRKMLDSI
jgi:restriction endonuclease S subunit